MKRNSPQRHAFTLVELMMVVGIIALVAAIAVLGYARARKRSQASRVLNDLRLIDSAVDQYALENAKAPGAPVTVPDWTNYMKKGSSLYLTGKDILGNSFGDQVVDTAPAVPPSSKAALSDVTTRLSGRLSGNGAGAAAESSERRDERRSRHAHPRAGYACREMGSLYFWRL